MAEAFILNNGINTDDATVEASQIMSGYTAYARGDKITGTGFGTTTTAVAGNIMSGKTAYSNTGELITGTGFGTTTTATASNIMSGKTAYSNTGTLLTGTGFGTTTTASSADIITGKTAYTSSGTLLTGTNPGVKTGTITISANSTTATVSGLGFTPSNAVLFMNGSFTGTNTTVDIVNCASYIGGTILLNVTDEHSYCYSYNYIYNYSGSSYLTVTISSGSVTFTVGSTYGYFYATSYRYVIW